MPQDKHGTFVAAKDMPKAAWPLQAKKLWSGQHDGWHIHVTRYEHDSLLHVVIQHTETFISHAARLPITRPSEAKVWASQQPSVLPEGWAP